VSPSRILVAGIGNIFLGDDAFGVEVAQRISRRGVRETVHVEDFGIRGYDLAFALTDDYDAVILVDATQRGGQPGTLYTIEPEWPEQTGGAPDVSAHGLDPASVLRLVQSLGGRPRRVLVVGCEPATLGDETEGALGLSPAVQAAVELAIELIDSLVVQLMGEKKDLCAWQFLAW
jgi:hydrogenase maturation protease